MSDLHYRPLADDGEVTPLAEILASSYGPTLEDSHRWIERSGPENARLVVRGRRIVGGLFLIPMGQFFGGRSVPMTGIGGVAVDPAERAGGAATHLMREAVRELHREGVALSSLFPATQPLYRRAGYERAGSHFAVKVEPQRLATEDRSLALRRVKEADREPVERLQTEVARQNDGNLDRNDHMWRRVRDPWRGPAHGFVVEDPEAPDGLAGYVYYVSKTNDRGHLDLVGLDVVARTPAAARRLLTFFRDHRSLVDTVRWRGHPLHPLLLQAREQRHELRLADVWMLRLASVERALGARGYPAGLEADLHLDVADDLLPENAGRFVLEVRNGEGRVERGGEGRICLDVRTLASIYTGLASPLQAQAGYGLQAVPEDTARMAAVFGGPGPWMQDGF